MSNTAPIQQIMANTFDQQTLAHILGNSPPMGHTDFSWGESDILRRKIVMLEEKNKELTDALMHENFFLGAILKKYNVSSADARLALEEARQRQQETKELEELEATIPEGPCTYFSPTTLVGATFGLGTAAPDLARATGRTRTRKKKKKAVV